MFELRLTIPVPRSVLGAGLTARIVARFQKAAGDLVTKAVQEVLGKDSLYTLSEKYRAVKPRRRGYKRQAGADADQPLIFSGNLLSGIGWHLDGDLIVIQVSEDHGLDKRGEDYSEIWEERVEYLEKGLDAVEDQLADLLLDIVFDAMQI